MASSSDDDNKAPLPLLRSDDNDKDHLCSRACGVHSAHDPTGAFDKVAPDLDWDVEPDNIIPAVPAVPPAGSDPGTPLIPASVRARPSPAVLQTRSDSDSGRVSDNKGILDAKHALWVKAGVDLKALVVAAIGTEHCSTVASTHTNGALRNCSALFIMEWLESEHGIIESQHVTERLATLGVVLAMLTGTGPTPSQMASGHF
jgi:hypothetical protein